MEDKNFSLLENIYHAVVKCITISENINSINELKNNKLLYDFLISNLVVIYEADSKLDRQIKDANTFIDWEKIGKYRKEVLSDYHELDTNLIWEIIKIQLPALKEKLERILF